MESILPETPEYERPPGPTISQSERTAQEIVVRGRSNAQSLHPLRPTGAETITKAVITPEPEPSGLDKAIDDYVAQKLKKIEGGKSHIEKEMVGGVWSGEYKRKVGVLEGAALAISKRGAALTGRAAEVAYGWWAGTAFARAIGTAVGAIVPGGQVVTAIVNSAESLSALPSAAADSGKSLRLPDVLMKKADRELLVVKKHEVYKEYKTRRANNRANKKGPPPTPEQALQYLEVCEAAVGIPAIKRRIEQPGLNAYERVRADIGASKFVFSGFNTTNSAVAGMGALGNAAATSAGLALGAVTTVTGPAALAIATVTGPLDIGQGVLEWKDGQTKKEFADSLSKAGADLSAKTEPPDMLMQHFGAALREYSIGLAEQAETDKLHAALLAIKGGMATTFGVGGLAAFGVGLATTAAAAPPVAAALGVAVGTVAGAYALAKIHRDYYARKYKDHQQKLQSSDFKWIGRHEDLVQTLTEWEREPEEAPIVHIRGMLNVAASLLDAAREGFPESIKGQSCGRMLVALGVDPTSEQWHAIMLASAIPRDDPRERIAFIERHLAKAISLDLIPVDSGSPQAPPAQGKPVDAAAVEEVASRASDSGSTAKPAADPGTPPVARLSATDLMSQRNTYIRV